MRFRFLSAGILAFLATVGIAQAQPIGPGNLPVIIDGPVNANDCPKFRATQSAHVIAVPCGSTNLMPGNPTATIGTSPVNGTADTYMRSDGAPKLPAILPTIDGQNITNIDASHITIGVFNCSTLPSLTGDGTTSGCAFTLPNVNSNPGTYGDSTHCPTFTTNTKGQITAASQSTTCPGSVSVTGISPIVITPSPGVNTFTVGATWLGHIITTGTYTIDVSDLSRLVNFNSGSAQAITVPSAATANFGDGSGFDVENINSGTATLTPAAGLINGLASLAIPPGTGCSLRSNGTNWEVSACTALTPATNAAGSNGDIQMNTAGAFAVSHFNDNGTIINSTESVNTKTNAIYSEVPNAAGSGTTLNKVAKFTGAPSTAVIATTADTVGVIGIVAGGAGTTGSAQIAVSGQVSCVFDGATVAGDFVIVSVTVNGDCHDGGAIEPLGVAVLGNVLSTHGGGGTYSIVLYPPNVSNAGNGNNGLKVTGSPVLGNLTVWSGTKSVTNGDLSGAVTTSGTLATTYNQVVPANKGGAGTITGALKADGSGNVSQANCASLSDGAPSCSTNALNATNISSGTLAAARLPSDVVYYDVNQSWSKAQRATPVTLTLSTATATPDFDNGQNFSLTLSSACPCTFANPSTTPVAGQVGVIKIIQDGTGSRTIGTWGSSYTTPAGVSVGLVLSTSANARDYFSYYVDDSTHIVITPGALNAVH